MKDGRPAQGEYLANHHGRRGPPRPSRAVRRGETISEEAQARLERDLYRSYLSAMQRTGRELRRLKDETDRLDQLEQLVAACGSEPEAKLLTLEAWLKALFSARRFATRGR